MEAVLNVDYFAHILVFFFIYSLVVFGLSYSTHAAGILSLGHGAFYGIGAYTAALLTLHLNVGFFTATVLAGLAALLASSFIGFCSVRLKEDYLAIATLAFLEVTRQLLYNWSSVTNGAYGLAGIPPAQLFGFQVRQPVSFLPISIVLSLFGIVIITRISRTPLGLSILASTDDPIALQTFGKRPTVLKLGVLSISAFLAGVAGSQYAFYVNYVHPNDFGLSTSIMFLAIAMIATARRPIAGCFVGLLLFFVTSELLRLLNFAAEVKGNLIQILTALTIFLVVLFRERRAKR